MILPRWSLVTIYKSFTRPYLDYGDINFDQELNKSFHDNLESIQYNALLAITGARKGTSKENPYQKLGFESLQFKGLGFANCALSTRYIIINLRFISTT